MLDYIMYTSDKTKSCDSSAIRSIMDKSEKNNLDIEITGVLMHTTNHFFQYLEGHKENIDFLIKKIKHDDKNENILIIAEGKTNKRIFPLWNMAYSQLTTTAENEQSNYFKSFFLTKNGNSEKSLDPLKSLNKLIKQLT